MARRLVRLFIALLQALIIASAAEANARPQRIVSMNLCTDQLVMLLVEPQQIASVSYLAQQPGSAHEKLRDVALTLHTNHGLAEEVLALHPDLIVGGQFTARTTTHLLRKLGRDVHVFAPAYSLEDVKANILRMGDLVGDTPRAEALVRSIDERLDALAWDRPDFEDMPVYADIGMRNFLPGSKSLASAIANAGGVRVLGETLGIEGTRQIPLETLVATTPELISNATRWDNPPSLATQALQHPAIDYMLQRGTTAAVPDALTICGTPYSIDAAEMLASARRGLRRAQ